MKVASIPFSEQGIVNNLWGEPGRKKVYVCGPMTGQPLWGFPAFDEARDRLESMGYSVISPADLDRAEGFDPLIDPEAEAPDRATAMRRDLAALMLCDGLVLLPGWEHSKGAAVEKFAAETCGLKVFLYDKDIRHALKPYLGPAEAPRSPEDDSAVLRAHSLVHGDRGQDYGHPIVDFSRTAKLWSALFDIDVTAEKVALAMICVKISRLVQTESHKDSVVDIAGYAETYHMVRQAREA